jgi:hypothetical protein
MPAPVFRSCRNAEEAKEGRAWQKLRRISIIGNFLT